MPPAPIPEEGIVTQMNSADMDAYLKAHPTVLYRYKGNTAGLTLLLVLGSISTSIGGSIWIFAGWDTVFHAIGIGSFLGVGLYLILLVFYWSYITRIAWAATSDQHLLMGRGRKLTAIKWSALELDDLWFSEPGEERVQGMLAVRLNGRNYRLRLYNRFICLINLQTFIAAILLKVHRPEQEDALKAGNGSAVSAPDDPDNPDGSTDDDDAEPRVLH